MDETLSAPSPLAPPAPTAPPPAPRSSSSPGRLLAFGLAGAGVGAVGGVIWWAVVDLAAYTVAKDGRATTTERGLTQFFAGDAWFCLIGVVLGLGLGLLAWRLFRDAGWVLPLVVVGTALAAALVCWLVGYRLGPGDFTHRLAIAEPGQQVPIALTLRAPVSLILWPFAAVLPVLLGASLGRDDEEVRPIRRRRRTRSRSDDLQG